VPYQDEQDPQYDREPSEDPPAAYRAVSAATLVAVRPGGGTSQLVHPEGVEVWDIDVAHDLVVGGRFGGPSRHPSAFPAASWFYWLVVTPVVGLLVLLVLLIAFVRRRRIRRIAGARRTPRIRVSE
jgi:hypothetical protein